jgi:hypothetical protein
MRDGTKKSYQVLSKKAFLDLMGRLMNGKAVMGPRERPDQPGFHFFDRVEDPDDLTMDYTTTTLPPKKAFFAPTETILTFTLGDPPKASDCRGEDPFVLVGVHPCDLSAIDALDRAYAYPPRTGDGSITENAPSLSGWTVCPIRIVFVSPWEFPKLANRVIYFSHPFIGAILWKYALQ